MSSRATRGSGLLEGFLARRRAAMATRLLRPFAGGRILDIGCGTTPVFLKRAEFSERVGLDRLPGTERPCEEGITFVHQDLEASQRLPFPDRSFDAVTMLAVFEHIEPAVLTPLLRDTRRVLRPDGPLVITTPAAWADPILRTLAALRLVSPEEIDEHKDAYDHGRIREYLVEAGYQQARIRTGSFELRMNLYVVAFA